MPDITQLPAQMTRVETGPLRFGDDWPGIFIRGDEALFMARYIEQALTTMPSHPVLHAMLKGLKDTLQSCSVGDTGWPP